MSLTTFTIHHRPKDDPNRFVLHQWMADRDGVVAGEVLLMPSLEEARAIPRSRCLVRFDREPGDEPSVIEKWL